MIIFPLEFLCVWSQVRKLKGSDEHLSVERAGGGQEVVVSERHINTHFNRQMS